MRFWESELPVDAAVRELSRLNDNIERYLDHLHVSKRGESIPSKSDTLYVGEPISELEMALKEHAEALGQTWPPRSSE